jgi:hypothetical protein
MIFTCPLKSAASSSNLLPSGSRIVPSEKETDRKEKESAMDFECTVRERADFFDSS